MIHTPVVMGLGITSAIGQGQTEFSEALFNGRSFFKKMVREGRQKDSAFIGAEVTEINYTLHLSSSLFRNDSLSATVAALTISQVWQEVCLSKVEPKRIGMIIGGSNIQQRELLLSSEPYLETPFYLRSQYGLSFLDSDVTGLCSELFGILRPSYTVGGASASGQLCDSTKYRWVM